MPRHRILALIAPPATVAPPQLVITSLSTPSATAGEPPFTLVVNGGGFASSNVVPWDGGIRPATFVSSMQLTAGITAALIAAPGTHSGRVKQSVFASVFSDTVTFTVNAPPPVATSLSPSTVTAGAPFTLIVNGAAFFAAGVVKIDGVAQPTTFVSATQLTAAVPSGEVPKRGPVAP
jgi:trimeric autotransporter adhesin